MQTKVTLRKRKGTKGWRWSARYYKDGQRIEKALGCITEQEAEREKAKIILGLQGGVTVSRRQLAFDSCADIYLQSREFRKPRSHKRVQQIFDSHLEPFFKFYSIPEIDTILVEKYAMDRLSSKRLPSNATVNKEVRCLKAMANWLIKTGKITEAQYHYRHYEYLQESSTSPGYYTEDDLATLYAKNPEHAHWWKFFVGTGLRLSEALRLKWEHVCYDTNMILIESTAEELTKSGKWRSVVITELAQEGLEKLEKDGNNPYVFPRMADKSLSRIARKEIRRAGLPGSLHTLRHTHITLLLLHGANRISVQKNAGHASIKTTERYTHVNAQDQQREIQLKASNFKLRAV